MTDDVFVIEYFGPPLLRKPHERQVPTPVGELCTFCNEAIADGDTGTRTPTNIGVVHYECTLRMAIGSVAHLERRCSCFIPGSEEGDPPGMTLREGALAAARAFHQT